MCRRERTSLLLEVPEHTFVSTWMNQPCSLHLRNRPGWLETGRPQGGRSQPRRGTQVWGWGRHHCQDRGSLLHFLRPRVQGQPLQSDCVAIQGPERALRVLGRGNHSTFEWGGRLGQLQNSGGQFNRHEKPRASFGLVFGPVLPRGRGRPPNAVLPIFYSTSQANFRAKIYVNWIDPQDADIAFIPELNRYVMTVNMMDRDGNPGGPAGLKSGYTRVIGVFSSNKKV